LYAFREAWRLALCLLFLATKFLRLSLLSLTSNSDIVPSTYILLFSKYMILNNNNINELKHKSIYMRDSVLLRRIVKQAEGLIRKMNYDITQKGTVPIDAYKNRCLDHIERVNQLTAYTHEEIEWAKRRLFKVYFTLQEYSGSERQVEALVPPLYEDQQISIDSVEHLLDEAVVHAFQKENFSGGMGFSTSRGMTLMEGMGQPVNQYWNATLAAVKHPVKQIDPATVEYKHRETTQEWRDRMAAEKDAILNRRPSNGETD